MHPGRILALAAATMAAALAAPPLAGAAVDLTTYARTGVYDLPVGTAPNLLASEASSVTYDWDTDSLFVVGDEGTAVVQVSKTGQLINSMPLASGAFDDTEGIAYIGGGEFVLVEERQRQINRFTYAAGQTLMRAAVKTVKLGTTIGNTGIEGIAFDPFSSGFVAVKEISPMGVFQTSVNWDAGTASNGSPTTENSTNLFDPALLGVTDIADAFSLSTITPADPTLLLLSQESARVVDVDRSGAVSSALNIGSEVGTEGVTMDKDNVLYLVNEAGGGSGKPQLWVYKAGTVQPSVALLNQVTSLAESSSTAARLKVADIAVTGGGTPTVGGADAAFFEIANNVLYLKAGTVLNRTAKPSYTVTVSTANATSAPLTLNITAAPQASPLIISEVSPWSSGNSPYAADWFEVTNTGTAAVSLAGVRVDDSSNAFSTSLALNGVDSIAPGQSVLFTEGTAATATALKAFWDIPNVPVGYYSGGGIGLSTDGDAVNLFDSAGNRLTGVSFGASTNFFTFDNPTGAATVSALSVPGRNGAYAIGGATGSPGAIAPQLAVTEVSPWSSGNSPYAADWFEVTNFGTHAVDLSGFKVDDSSNAFATAIALNGVSLVAPGESVLFTEGTAATADALKAFWFPAGTGAPQVGTYSGSGIGLSTDGDAVNLFDPSGRRITGVTFGASTTYVTFDNAAGASGAISKLSVLGSNGAFTVAGATGSPGSIVTKTVSASTGGTVNGTVPATLAITLGAPATFGPFAVGVDKLYTAQTTATVTSTAGEATLTASTGKLANGAFSLAEPLQIDLSQAAWNAPVTNAAVTVTARQHIGANEPLRTGAYSTTVTLTLSTTTP